MGSGALSRVDLEDLVLIANRVLLHAEPARDVIAGGELLTLGLNHHANRPGTHHFADLHRRNIGAALVHPTAHGGIERHIQDLDEHLTV